MSSNELLNYHLKRCFNSNKESQEYIYNNYYSSVESLCENYSSDVDELIILINECFVFMFKNFPFDGYHRISADCSFYKWLRKCVMCGIVDYSRRNFKHQQLLHFKHVPLSEHAVLWEDFFKDFYPVQHKILTEEINGIINSLSSSNKIILNLIVLEKFSVDDLADCLKITIGIASANISNLMEQIKNIIRIRNSNNYESRISEQIPSALLMNNSVYPFYRNC